MLVVALGALQYRWVGQVSERERDQLRESLDRRARDFADDFDREISRAYQVFEPDAEFAPSSPDRFAQHYGEWQTTSPFAGLVKTVYFAEASHDSYTLYRYLPATRRLRGDRLARRSGAGAAPRPVSPRAAGRRRREFFHRSGADRSRASVPALVIPQIRRNTVTEQRADGVFTAGGDGQHEGDDGHRPEFRRRRTGQALHRASMLPALVQRHFPETGSDRFRVQVSAGPNDVLFSRGWRPGQTIESKAADALRRFSACGWRSSGESSRARRSWPRPRRHPLQPQRRRQVRAIRWRPPGARNWKRGSAPAHGAVTQETLVLTAPPMPRQAGPDQTLMVFEQSTTAREPVAAAGWTLLLQHEAGSLDAAVALARRRNLFLSFGILSVLAASAGLVMVNARRSEKLAAQQMEFVATVSHELRTPLAVIRSAAQNLSAGVVHDAGQAQRYGDLIESEGRRLTDMVEQVLEYAGLNDAKPHLAPKPMDAVPVAPRRGGVLVVIAGGRGVDFDVRIDGRAGRDGRRGRHPARAQQPDRQRAEVRPRRPMGGRHVRRAAQGRDDGFVLVSVADRGHGIAADDLAHIFEPFYRGRAPSNSRFAATAWG